MNTVLKYILFAVVISVLSWLLPNLLIKPNPPKESSKLEINTKLKLLKTEGELSLINTDETGVIEIIPTIEQENGSDKEPLDVLDHIYFVSNLDIDVHIFNENKTYLKSISLTNQTQVSDFSLKHGLYYLQFIDSKQRSKTIWIQLEDKGDTEIHRFVA